jgi:alginate O-acetyltransferase complex protein AlgI
MRFTTIYYLFFFLVVFLVYWALPRKHRPAMIFAASLVFYAAWSWKFSIHLMLVLAVNYWFLLRIFDRKSKGVLVTIVVLNAANLFFFKYLYFLFEIIAATVGGASVTPAFNAWLQSSAGVDSIILPLAISFYTFQLIGLQVDAFRGQIAERPIPLHYLMFSMYFPHFVAGPIMRHSDFFHQLEHIQPDQRKLFEGLFLIGSGLLKKVVVADNVDNVLRPVFADPGSYDGQTNFLAAVAYAMRVYCDFSGYTDIARGSSKLLGLEIPENFKGPFLSLNVSELWNRWHVTLMMWLRDYVYIPLGGSRRSEPRNIFNLNFTMLVSGVWHGANYTYALWGLYNGFLVTVERFFRRQSEGKTSSRWVRILATIVGLVYVQLMFSLGMVLFNGHSLDKSITMYGRIFTMADGKHWAHDEYLVYIVVITYLFNAAQRFARWEWVQTPWKRYAATLCGGLLVMLLMGAFPPGTSDFIYFQF